MQKIMMISFKTNTFLCICLAMAAAAAISCPAAAEIAMDGVQDLGVGLPMGAGADAPDLDVCPNGASTVYQFLKAWEKSDFRTMYSLIDDESKKDYTFEQARIDFSCLEFKPYNISSLRQDGSNFEFVISYGDWKSGDKDVKKILISGKTFKILLTGMNSPFKRSIADYM